MKRHLVLVLITFTTLLTSCSTLLSHKTYKVNVSSNAPNAKVRVYDSIYELPSKVEVERSKKELPLELITDTEILNYKIKPVLDPKFVFVNLSGFIFAPVNYAVDLTNPKRFYYRKSIFLDTNDTLRTIVPERITKGIENGFKRYFSTKLSRQKGNLYTQIGLPFVNGFKFKPELEGNVNIVGMMGFTVGLDYYHTDNQFLSLRLSLVEDYNNPVPITEDPGDNLNMPLSSAFVSLSNNHQFNRLSVGYGIAFARNMWEFVYKKEYQFIIMENKKSAHNAIGLVVPVHFTVFNNFNVGAIYRPTFYTFGHSTKFQYEHLLSLEFSYKFKIRKPAKMTYTSLF